MQRAGYRSNERGWRQATGERGRRHLQELSSEHEAGKLVPRIGDHAGACDGSALRSHCSTLPEVHMGKESPALHKPLTSRQGKAPGSRDAGPGRSCHCILAHFHAPRCTAAHKDPSLAASRTALDHHWQPPALASANLVNKVASTHCHDARQNRPSGQCQTLQAAAFRQSSR